MKEMEAKQTGQNLPILQKMDLLVKATADFSSMMSAAEKSLVISTLEKDTIVSSTLYNILRNCMSALKLDELFCS